VRFEEKDRAKAAGAKWNPDKKQWYYPSTEIPESLNEFVGYKETPMKERSYLYVPYDDHVYAKSKGAKWDQVRRQWYYPKKEIPEGLKGYVEEPRKEKASTSAQQHREMPEHGRISESDPSIWGSELLGWEGERWEDFHRYLRGGMSPEQKSERYSTEDSKVSESDSFSNSSENDPSNYPEWNGRNKGTIKGRSLDAEWKEGDHPRAPSGTPEGGEFAGTKGIAFLKSESAAAFSRRREPEQRGKIASSREDQQNQLRDAWATHGADLDYEHIWDEDFESGKDRWKDEIVAWNEAHPNARIDPDPDAIYEFGSHPEFEKHFDAKYLKGKKAPFPGVNRANEYFAEQEEGPEPVYLSKRQLKEANE
jgi:hypothetical protein